MQKSPPLTVTEALGHLDALHSSGALTADEFARAKGRVLADGRRTAGGSPDIAASVEATSGTSPETGDASATPAVPDSGGARVSLYRPYLIIGASFAASPLAGAWVAAQNWKRLGRPLSAAFTWFVAVAVFAAQCAVVFAHRSDSESYGRPLLTTLPVLFGALAAQRQERVVKARIAAGASWRSGKGAIAATIIIGAMIYLAFLGLSRFGV